MNPKRFFQNTHPVSHTLGLRGARFPYKASEMKFLVLSDFSKMQQYNLKKLAQLFQVAVHFHPSHLQLKTLIDCFNVMAGGALVWIIHFVF